MPPNFRGTYYVHGMAITVCSSKVYHPFLPEIQLRNKYLGVWMVDHPITCITLRNGICAQSFVSEEWSIWAPMLAELRVLALCFCPWESCLSCLSARRGLMQWWTASADGGCPVARVIQSDRVHWFLLWILAWQSIRAARLCTGLLNF